MPLVAEEDGRLPGYIMLSEAVIRTEGGEVGALAPDRRLA